MVTLQKKIGVSSSMIDRMPEHGNCLYNEESGSFRTWIAHYSNTPSSFSPIEGGVIRSCMLRRVPGSVSEKWAQDRLFNSVSIILVEVLVGSETEEGARLFGQLREFRGSGEIEVVQKLLLDLFDPLDIAKTFFSAGSDSSSAGWRENLKIIQEDMSKIIDRL